MDPYDFNCVHAVQAYELRRRGDDVEATGLPAELMPGLAGAGGRTLPEIEKAWGIRFVENTPGRVVAAVRKDGPGSRGFVAVRWKFGGGHVFCAENVGGDPVFVDPQTGETDVSDYFLLAAWTAYARVDHATPGSEVLEFAVRSGR